MTLQRDLRISHKSLAALERELDACRQQLAEAREQAAAAAAAVRKNSSAAAAGSGVGSGSSQQREEIRELTRALRHAEAEAQSASERLRAAESRAAQAAAEQRAQLDGAEAEIRGLQERLLRQSRSSRDAAAAAEGALADEVEDLKAELRERDMLLEEKTEQVVCFFFFLFYFWGDFAPYNRPLPPLSISLLFPAAAAVHLEGEIIFTGKCLGEGAASSQRKKSILIIECRRICAKKLRLSRPSLSEMRGWRRMHRPSW